MIVTRWIEWGDEEPMPSPGAFIYASVVSGPPISSLQVKRVIVMPDDRDFVEVEYDDPSLDE